MKKALICGISGQDGSYLAKLLLEKGYQVFGGSRDAQSGSFENLIRIKIKESIQLVSINITDFRNTLQTIKKIKPDEIYNLSGQSSVGLSFEQPVETLESFIIGNLNLLESIRFIDLPIKLFNAASSECFGDTLGKAADEETAFRPRSPYAVAKAAAFWQLANYREAYQIFGCTGILFNHESPLRKDNFVTKKIIATACRIHRGSKEKLFLGNTAIIRDWGWAPEYVVAMWKMMQEANSDDYVIATGVSNSLQDFIHTTFSKLDLIPEDHVFTDLSLLRLTDLSIGKANPQKAAEKLDWKATVFMEEVIERMIEAELRL